MQLKPSKLSVNQVKSIVRVIVYLAISGAISSLIVYATDNQESIGFIYPAVNFILYTLKQYFTLDSQE